MSILGSKSKQRTQSPGKVVKAKSNGKIKSKSADKSSKAKESKETTETTDAAVLASTSINENVIIKRLADNSRKVREKALNTVRSYLGSPRTLELFQLQKLWVGLYYSMWHSDRPLTQQALARELASLVDNIKEKNLWTFINAFWSIMIRQWETLDHHRIDKFYLLVRSFVSSCFKRLAENSWEDVEKWNKLLLEGPLNPTSLTHPQSLRFHLIDIYVDELAKVFEAQDETPEEEVLKLLMEPILIQLELSSFKLVKQRIKDDVLTDERLIEWKVVDDSKDVAEGQAAENGESDEGEWDGFD